MWLLGKMCLSTRYDSNQAKTKIAILYQIMRYSKSLMRSVFVSLPESKLRYVVPDRLTLADIADATTGR